jgi:glycine cleavage system H lipoate-binding protein
LIANKDPYGKGWLIKVRVLKPQTARDNLITGIEAVEYYQKRIDDQDMRCFRCVDDPVPMQKN